MNAISKMPVVIRDLPAHEYHTSGADILSGTGTHKLLSVTPAEFREAIDNPPEPSKSLDFGDAAHTMALEPEQFVDRYFVMPKEMVGPKLNTTEGRALKAEIEKAGRRSVSFDDYQIIRAMADQLLRHPLIGSFLDAESEVSCFWTDALFATGSKLRARIDRLPHSGRLILDYKTSADISDAGIDKAQTQFGYATASVHYEEGAWACGLRGDDCAMVFLSQMKTAPYLVRAWQPRPEVMKWARHQVRKARTLFARCTEAGIWPGYPEDEIYQADLPGWLKHRAQLEMENADV